MIDFSDCTSEMPAFVTNERALILEAKVKELAAHVATAIENVPAFRPGLPVALNKTLEDLSGVLGSLRGKRAYEGDHLDDVATGLLRLG